MRTIAEIAEDVRTQDNRITANPIFIVQQKRRITGLDPQYADSDKIVWIEDGYGEVKDPDEIKRLDAEYEKTYTEPDGYTRSGYLDIWEFVTACFTENGCEDYLRQNGHNLREPRIYVEGGHRNDEWQTLRRFLLNHKPDAPTT